MSGLFNRLYNGKNRSDYTPDQLPDNRFKLFFEMLKTRFFKLFQLNLMFVVFTLPLLFFLFSLFLYVMMNPEEALPMLNQTLLFCVPCMGIVGIGMTGMTYITRNWARDEHAWVFSDFIDTIKHNWKQGLVMGLLDGLLVFVMVFAGQYYAIYSGENFIFYILGWLMVVFLAVLAMVNLYAWPMIIGYDLKLRQILRNCLILALGRLPWSLLFLVITILPLAVFVLVPQATMFLFFYYVLIGFALHTFINVSYTNAAFDKFINVKIEGAPVNMGLRADDDDEYDDEEE